MSDYLKKANDENYNPIIRRVAVLCKMRLLSPALIGSGESENTKRDVYLDAKGNPVLPGTSIAGVLRSSLDVESAAKLFGALDKEGTKKLFGPLIDSNNASAITSPLWVFDVPLYDAKIITIDNVALDENKVAKPDKKFDFEAIDRGAGFDLRLQLIIRKNSCDGLEDILGRLLGKLSNLYVGGKTSRGFGKLECESIHKLAFGGDGTELEKWKGFKWDQLLTINPEPKQPKYTSEHGEISAMLKLKGSLLIRDDYSVIGKEDSAQITSNGRPVIYGTSMAGAIKGGLARFLKTQGYQNCNSYLDKVFGYPDKHSDDKQTFPSKVRVDASYFGKDKRHLVTRVKIDRWTGGAANRALFTSRPQFKGEVILRVQYPKGDEAIYQLLLLALQAIDLGLVTIGGETAIGRGVFSVEKICIDGIEKPKCQLFKLPKHMLREKLLEEPKGGAIND
ncbi:MAG: RAMP superfamily CRISPR-associated protein [Defluviitaleaceae bacterium]|nr:RAMP superfamily CRISPR-associated protein [Defluviitaleaceae bacterium]